MSYSLNVRAATKADAKAAVSVELDKVVAQQPVHAKDRDIAAAAADAHIDMLGDDDTQDIAVTVSGSVGGVWDASELTTLTNASVSVYTSRISRDAI